MKTKIKIGPVWIVLAFAVLHALCCIFCRTIGIEDTRVLTLLSVAMTFILCYLHDMKIYFIVAAIIVFNVLAYLMGSAIPLILIPLMGQSLWVNVISTFLTTTILGLLFELAITLLLGMVGSGSELRESPRPRQYRQRWIVRLNERIVPVKTEQIAYFFSEDKSNYLVTFDGERYLIDSTMDSILEDLDPKAFFRINRGCILSLSSIDSALIKGGRYIIEAHPALGIQMVVSRPRVDDFLHWMQ